MYLWKLEAGTGGDSLSIFGDLYKMYTVLAFIKGLDYKNLLIWLGNFRRL